MRVYRISQGLSHTELVVGHKITRVVKLTKIQW